MNTRLLDARDPSNAAAAIEAAAELIGENQLVGFPTETVYGLGATALESRAIEKVFVVKGRPADNPLIVHVADTSTLDLCAFGDERVEPLARAFMPGPLTLVLRARPVIPSIARGGLETVAVRIPDHPVALRLLQAAGPLVGPSANLSGRPSPTTAVHVLEDLGGKIAAVLDGGPCSVGIESTVLDLSTERPAVLRPGRISARQIAEVLGTEVDTASASTSHRSPGTRYRHYAPRASLRLVVDTIPPDTSGAAGRLLVLAPAAELGRFGTNQTEALSEAGFYASLREADRRGIAEILVWAPPGSIATGLLDRVRRAAGEKV